MLMERKDPELLKGSKKIVERRYLALAELPFINKPDKWEKTFTEYAALGIDYEDGFIVKLEGTARKRGDGTYEQVAFSSDGMEIAEEQANQMEERLGRGLPRFKVWDFRVKDIIETDGPEARTALMETHEQNKKRLREEQDRQYNLQQKQADAMSQLSRVLEGQAKKLTPEQLEAAIMEMMDPEKVAALAKQMEKAQKG